MFQATCSVVDRQEARFDVVVFNSEGNRHLTITTNTWLTAAIAAASGFNGNGGCDGLVAVVLPTESELVAQSDVEQGVVPVKLPHTLEEDDFVEMSLVDWIETWMRGFSECEIDEIYARAEGCADKILAGIVDMSESCLSDACGYLTPAQSCKIWHELIGASC